MIRTATNKDVLEISALVSRSVYALNASDDSADDLAFVCSKYTPQRISEHLIHKHVFVAADGLTILGVVILDGDKVHSLFVEPTHAKKGIRATLLKHVENCAIQNGISTLRISSSRTAVAFYEKLGFHKLNFEPREFAPTWAMEKIL